jgi:hypothetical protein
MIVQLDLWARVTPEKPRGVALLYQRSIPSLDTRRARATYFGAYKQVGSTPTSGAMKADRSARGAKARGRMTIVFLQNLLGEDAPRWGT